ncbi:MAG: hypothetical protein Terrestrivirus2_111 [Terrestrivirus sp.]|uniref:Uncharacterized protein n=1 Tax=Terrestrivirus sp. TaxID=2487775 RepID=A0A3G4ZPR9_9VIRU|nr:MAG: hypothetical protein Terrestrivirus2_111 [Terrestrivirus sp.]
MSRLFKLFSRGMFILCSMICFTNFVSVGGGIAILVINQEAMGRVWKVWGYVLLQTVLTFSSTLFIFGSLVSVYRIRNTTNSINYDRQLVGVIDFSELVRIPSHIIRQKILTHFACIFYGVNIAISSLGQIIYYNIDPVSLIFYTKFYPSLWTFIEISSMYFVVLYSITTLLLIPFIALNFYLIPCCYSKCNTFGTNHNIFRNDMSYDDSDDDSI